QAMRRGYRCARRRDVEALRDALSDSRQMLTTTGHAASYCARFPSRLSLTFFPRFDLPVWRSEQIGWRVAGLKARRVARARRQEALAQLDAQIVRARGRAMARSAA
ncbi:MAG TPA: hypothetical protein VIN36_00185, partial [Thiobacillus sp.]